MAENILSYLDADSLKNAELVCKEWFRVISEGMLWKKLIERKVRTDALWRGLAERRQWIQYLFKPRPGENHRPHSFYRSLYPKIIRDIDSIESNWRNGQHILQRINCRSENSKGVYCLQYDDQKIVSGLRDNTIKVKKHKWSLELCSYRCNYRLSYTIYYKYVCALLVTLKCLVIVALRVYE